MKNRTLVLGAAISIAALSACRSKPKNGGPLPTPMSLGTPEAAATTATPRAATTAAAVAGPNQPPTIAGLKIDVANPGGGGVHPNAADTLKASATITDPDGDLVSTHYQWELNGAVLGEGDTLPPGKFKKGDTLLVKVHATDAKGAASEGSTMTHILNSAPTFTSTPGASLNGYHPVASDPDGDNVTIEATSLPAGFSFSGGTLSFDASAGTAAKGQSITFVAKDPDGASATQGIVVNF